MGSNEILSRVASELSDGMALPKCRQCGCMKDTLVGIQAGLTAPGMATEPAFVSRIEAWVGEMQAVRYVCLGCDYCIAAAATNLFVQAFPNAEAPALSCAFEMRSGKWPVVPGDYLLLNDDAAPVAVSTLASLDLPQQVAALKPAGLALIGKTETENIGLDKIIKNVIANPALRYLILTGKEAEGHRSGQTLLCLAQNGVDEKLRVIGSQGKRPVLRNVTEEEVSVFRQQVQVVDMIGCEDAAAIASRVVELAGELPGLCSDTSCSCHSQPSAVLPIAFDLPLSTAAASCGWEGACQETAPVGTAAVPVIQAKAPSHVELDKAGYFVVIVQRDRGVIVIEHYGYDNTLTGVIEGQDARSIYWTAIQNAWVSELSHAAYLGKELAKAEMALQSGWRYIQDGA